MSTAVYLATSTYISKLVVADRILPVTPRNVHRLTLAGLRVAMKALEDMSWPHGRFAKVGGVNEAELGRLEISFCFLMDFNLKVDVQGLSVEAEGLARTYQRGMRGGGEGLGIATGGGGGDSAILDTSPISAGGGGNMELKMPASLLVLPDQRPRSRGGGAGEKRKASSNLPSRPNVSVERGKGIEVMGQS